MDRLRMENGFRNPCDRSDRRRRTGSVQSRTLAAEKLVDALYPSGLQGYWGPGFLTEISGAAIDTMVAWCAHRPSPVCRVVIEHVLGGGVSRSDRDAPGFNHRDG